MFKFLKEKISGWTKKVAKEAETVDIEEPVEDVEKSLEEEKSESGGQAETSIKKQSKRTEKEIKIPEKFDVAKQKYEPDLEKVKEIEKEISKEEAKPGTKSFFDKITSKIQKIKISEKEFEVYSEELKMLLLENNVAFEVADKIIEELKTEIVGKEFLKKEIEAEINESLKNIIRGILIEPFDIIERIKEKTQDQAKEPFVMLFSGVNGTGKTTTIAKIASFLTKKGFSCVLAAADTFRAASIEQLEKHGDRLGIKVISHAYGSDPASVGFDAIQYAKKNFVNVVLIDTAGRMHTEKNLLKEIEKISRVCKPDLKLFVGESITGNDAVEQVRSFDEAIGIDGIILAKADVDEKGGTALSVGYITRKPILYLGTGQEYKSITPFSKKKFVTELGL